MSQLSILEAGAAGWLFCFAAAFGQDAAGSRPVEPELGRQGDIIVTPQALRIHAEGLLIDGHNDLLWEIRKQGASSFDRLDIRHRQEKLQTDIPRLFQGGVGGQFFAVYVPPETAHSGEAARMALEQFDLFDEMVRRYSDVFEAARTADDVERIHRSGKIAALLGIEGGHVIENSLEKLNLFYRRGARYMGLTHTETTDWADSSTDEPRHGGLSEFGEAVVLEMNRLGMLVDLAHTSPDCMRDALRVSRAPVIISHASAYAVAPHARNVPDDVLRLLAAKDGVMCVTFFSGYLHSAGARAMTGYFEKQRALKEEHPDAAEYEKAWKTWKAAHPIPPGTVGDVVDQIDYVVKIAGIDHVGLGGDYDGVGVLPVQLEDVSGYPCITQELLNGGYRPADIHKIMGANLLRVLRRAELAAQE